MTVYELAKRVGVAAHVVRYYTQRGLLSPARNSRNRYREYGESDLYRMQFICRAKTVGFTLADIELTLRDADRGLAPCAEVRRLVQLRSQENEQRLVDAEELQRRIRQAVETWEAIPDRPPDHQSLCRLIECARAWARPFDS